MKVPIKTKFLWFSFLVTLFSLSFPYPCTPPQSVSVFFLFIAIMQKRSLRIFFPSPTWWQNIKLFLYEWDANKNVIWFHMFQSVWLFMLIISKNYLILKPQTLKDVFIMPWKLAQRQRVKKAGFKMSIYYISFSDKLSHKQLQHYNHLSAAQYSALQMSIFIFIFERTRHFLCMYPTCPVLLRSASSPLLIWPPEFGAFILRMFCCRSHCCPDSNYNHHIIGIPVSQNAVFGRKKIIGYYPQAQFGIWKEQSLTGLCSQQLLKYICEMTMLRGGGAHKARMHNSQLVQREHGCWKWLPLAFPFPWHQILASSRLSDCYSVTAEPKGQLPFMLSHIHRTPAPWGTRFMLCRSPSSPLLSTLCYLLLHKK